jgi:uncharacterized protein
MAALVWLLGGALTAVKAASFDCTKATYASEKAVCATPRLSQLDDQMAKLYFEGRALSKNQTEFVRLQVEWIKQVRLCEANTLCLERSLLQRIATLTQEVTASNLSDLRQIDGVWYSNEWKYGYSLNNGVGVATSTNSTKFNVGDRIVFLTHIGDNLYEGRQIYKDGNFYKVRVTLQSDGRLFFQGEKNVSWLMDRVAVAPEANKPAVIASPPPNPAPPTIPLQIPAAPPPSSDIEVVVAEKNKLLGQLCEFDFVIKNLTKANFSELAIEYIFRDKQGTAIDRGILSTSVGAGRSATTKKMIERCSDLAKIELVGLSNFSAIDGRPLREFGDLNVNLRAGSKVPELSAALSNKLSVQRFQYAGVTLGARVDSLGFTLNSDRSIYKFKDYYWLYGAYGESGHPVFAIDLACRGLPVNQDYDSIDGVRCGDSIQTLKRKLQEPLVMTCHRPEWDPAQVPFGYFNSRTKHYWRVFEDKVIAMGITSNSTIPVSEGGSQACRYR